jgi:hypothetical protein
MKNKPNWLIQAAGKAQKAADYILGITQPNENEKLDKERAAA